jgi:hypothetical protein
MQSKLICERLSRAWQVPGPRLRRDPASSGVLLFATGGNEIGRLPSPDVFTGRARRYHCLCVIDRSKATSLGKVTMPFNSFPLAFALDITNNVNAILQGLQPSQCPLVLYHSTSFPGITGIIDARALWGTCIDDLEDKTEIQHGVEMIEEEIRQRRFDRKSVAGRILRLVPEFLSERRRWTFVACFRETLGRQDADPAAAANCVKWERYRPYCAEFETLSAWEPRLRSGMHADRQYHRVIYDKALQRAAVARIITATIDCTAKNCIGSPEGPWGESLAKIHARIVAQSFIDMISGFKSPAYAWEDEWRIVCRPRFTHAGSAPNLEDENFRPYVKSGSLRYVELAAHEQGPIFSAFPARALAFRAIHVSDPGNRLASERQRIRSMLDKSGRSDISLRSYAR